MKTQKKHFEVELEDKYESKLFLLSETESKCEWEYDGDITVRDDRFVFESVEAAKSAIERADKFFIIGEVKIFQVTETWAKGIDFDLDDNDEDVFVEEERETVYSSEYEVR